MGGDWYDSFCMMCMIVITYAHAYHALSWLCCDGGDGHGITSISSITSKTKNKRGGNVWNGIERRGEGLGGH